KLHRRRSRHRLAVVANAPRAARPQRQERAADAETDPILEVGLDRESHGVAIERARFSHPVAQQDGVIEVADAPEALGVAHGDTPGVTEWMKLAERMSAGNSHWNQHGPTEVTALLMNDVLLVLPEPEALLPGRAPVDRAQHGPVVRRRPRSRPAAQP